MAAPTQELPTWLSYTTITLPETTVTSVIFLPLTYYGPSIPLDSDWVYGGLTSPAPSATPSATDTATTTTDTTPPSSATPSAPSTSAVVPPTSSDSVSASSPTASSSTSGSGSPAASSSASPSSHLSRGGLIGVIFGSVLGALVLFLLLLCCWLRYGARRRDRTRGESTTPATREKSRTPLTALFTRRRPRARTRFTMVTPPVPGAPLHEDDDLEGDWTMVGSPFSPTSPTSPISPRSPGSPEPGQGVTEADPFLTRARMPNPHSAEGDVAGSGSGSGANSASASSRGTGTSAASSGTNVSGYGVLLAHPSLAMPAPHPHAEGRAGPHPTTYANLPPGAAAPGSARGNGSNNGNAPPPVPGRRILSPAQMAILVEEDSVLPRASEDSVEEGEVVVARRVSVKKSVGGSAAAGVLAVPVPSLEKERRRSWIPRFSWLGSSRRNSRDVEAGEGEGEGQELLFDAGHGHSPSNSISGPLSPLDTPPRLVGQGASTSGASGSGSGSGATMREFGARALLPFLASRPGSGVAAGSRPMSGVSGPSGTGSGSDGTTGSGKSGGTVYTDARETLSTRGSRPSSRVRGWEGAEAPPPTPPLPTPLSQSQGHSQDPLDAPAPPALAAFAGSQTSLHRQQSREEEEDLLHNHSRDNSMSGTSHQQTATLAGSASNTTLATDAPLKPEPAYAYGPPGLGGFAFDSLARNNHGSFTPAGKGKAGSIGSWDKAGLELGFSRPASHSQLGTFGSANAVPVPIRVGGAPAAFGGVGGGHGAAPMFGGAVPEVRGSSAPHLSLDLDDAPPGAEGRWRLLGGGSSNPSQEWGEGAGRRGTFGLSPAAQFHPSAGHSSEHGSFHSSSLSSGSSHAVRVAAGSQHSLYPSSGSGGSARARLLTHAGSVEGPMSPTLSAFGHRARDAEHSGSSGSGGRRQENSSGSGSGAGEHVRSPLARAASPVSSLLSPWAGGLDPDWRPM